MVAFAVRRKLFICSHIVPFDNSQWITLEPQMARQHGQLRKQQQKDLGPSAALATTENSPIVERVVEYHQRVPASPHDYHRQRLL